MTQPVRAGVEERLAETLLHLVNIESVSRHEQAITDWIRREMEVAGWTVLAGAADWLVCGARPTGAPVLVLAGHTDTVPVQGNLPGRAEGGFVHGLGASDMKAALAVMIELARSIPPAAERACDPVFAFFGHEELATHESLVPDLLAGAPIVSEAALVLMMEPTANQVHAGCAGNISARLEFEGVAAHSARPWLGRNAIHEAITSLQAVAAMEPVDVEVEGLVFREVVSITTIEGGVANNVVPDHVACGVNYRYAPGRTPDEAEARLRGLLGAGGRLHVISNAPSAPVAIRNPLVERLRAVGGMPTAPKQAWTPVAEFAAAGLDAVNYGPGDPAFAHRRDERVEVAAMAESLRVLSGMVLGG